MNDRIRIEIAGELGIATAADVREQLLAALAGVADVEVDLAGVTEMDCAGVQLMVAAMREAAAQEKTLRFTALSAAVQDTLALCDLACPGAPGCQPDKEARP